MKAEERKAFVEGEIPVLMQILYGQGAAERWEQADEKVRWWAEGFECWLNQWKDPVRGRQYYQVLQRSWKDFLSVTGKSPWDAVDADAQLWVEDMERRNYLQRTIKGKLGHISSFYKYINKPIKPGKYLTPEPINPALETSKQQRSLRQKNIFLNGQEARALLERIDKQDSMIGKRDYAYILAALASGLTMKELRMLRWGEIGVDETGCRIFLPRRIKLEAYIWSAIEEYLRSCGRWERMQPEEYVFPVRRLSMFITAGQADDWLGSRPLGPNSWIVIIRQYAALAGLNARLITTNTIRNTAAMLRLEAGEEKEKLAEFLSQRSWKNPAANLYRLITADKKPLWAEDKEEAGYKENWDRPNGLQRLETTRLETLSPALSEDEIRRLEEEDTLDTLERGLAELRRMSDELVQVDMPQAGEHELRKIAHQSSLATARIGQILPLQDKVKIRRQKDAEIWARWNAVVDRIQSGHEEDGEIEVDDEI